MNMEKFCGILTGIICLCALILASPMAIGAAIVSVVAFFVVFKF